MRFFIVSFCRGTNPMVSMCDFPDRATFLASLKLDNEASISKIMGWTYQEIPPSCVKKLFPNVEWRLGTYLPIPEDV